MSRFALVLIVFLAGLSPAAAFNWTVHADPAGTRLELPDYFRWVGPGAPDGSGARFRAEDGAEIRVFATRNTGGVEMGAILRAIVAQSDGAFARVTYQNAGADWFVLSGYRRDGETIYYSRYELSADRRVISSFEITYPRQLRRAYDPIVTRMSLRFETRIAAE